jgi:hypothetical protein
MFNDLMEDEIDDAILNVKQDAYWDALELFWQHVGKFQTSMEKDWEELGFWEVEEAKRDYEMHMERELNPESFYGTSGTR